MRYIGARPRRRVELIQTPLEPAQRFHRTPEPWLPLRRDIGDREAEKAVKIIARDRQRAIHIAFARRHIRREHDAPGQRGVMQRHRNAVALLAIVPRDPVWVSHA